MWCAIKCRTGRAEEVMESCRRNISGTVLRDIFVFTYECMRRYEGSWHVETREMFPDYVFLETESPEKLSESLEPYRAFAQVLEDGTMLRRVLPEEEKLLRKLCGDRHHMGMSEGYIRDGITHVTCGPLVGMERGIRKIDRHKRIAHIEFPSREHESTTERGIAGAMIAGLEIKSKS